MDIIHGCQLVLTQPLNFYSFAIMINTEQIKEIMDQTYPKMLEAKIEKIEQEKAGQRNELVSTH